MRGRHVISAIEAMTGNDVPDWLEAEIVRGADELDLVRSGLDDTMRLAYQEISQARESNKQVNDFRTAAYVVAVSKISRSYLEIGVY
jgi:glutamate dehydrogenase (NAD(P)+)